MRKFSTLIALIMCWVILCTNVIGQDKAVNTSGVLASVMTGYHRGFSIKGNLMPVNFAKGFPFRIRFGIGYSFLNPGNAADARRIFVNNATNGVPEKKGRAFDFRIDLIKQKQVFGLTNSSFLFGPRFSTFNGDFKYVGGNEDFEVKSHQWGLGGGIEHYFRLTEKLGLSINYGLDFYVWSTLTGHDTSYSPDNDNINPKDNNENGDLPFSYRDADRAIRQPVIMPYFMAGLYFGL